MVAETTCDITIPTPITGSLGGLKLLVGWDYYWGYYAWFLNRRQKDKGIARYAYSQKDGKRVMAGVIYWEYTNCHTEGGD